MQGRVGMFPGAFYLFPLPSRSTNCTQKTPAGLVLYGTEARSTEEMGSRRLTVFLFSLILPSHANFHARTANPLGSLVRLEGLYGADPLGGGDVTVAFAVGGGRFWSAWTRDLVAGGLGSFDAHAARAICCPVFFPPSQDATCPTVRRAWTRMVERGSGLVDAPQRCRRGDPDPSISSLAGRDRPISLHAVPRSHPNPPAFSARRNCLPQNARPSGRLVSGQFGFLTHRPRCRARVCSPSWFAEVGGCSGEGGCHQPQRLGSDHASSARLSTQDEDQGRASRSIPIRPLFTGALSKCPLRMILRASGKLGVPACAPMAHGSGKDTVGIGGPL